MRLSTIKVAYSTDSAGMHDSHTLPLKLRAIGDAGFSLVELAFPDLEAFAAQEHPGYKKLDNAGNGDMEVLQGVAQKVKEICDSLSVKVLVVHPFSRFEGYTDPEKRQQSLSRVAAWFKILKIFDCTMLQVGSSDDPKSSSDFDTISSDFQELADLGAAQEPVIQIAYEMWAWGVHVNTWEHTWDICRRVDRPNFGLCLDTFQICARAYASPTAPSRLLESASATLQSSLENLSKTIPASKIFYFQISDGSKNIAPEELQKEAKEQGIDPLYAWSNKWRPLPYMNEVFDDLDCSGKDFGGYLPVIDVIKAVLKTGWRGPWSYEVFYAQGMLKPHADVPRMWAQTAMQCHQYILKEIEAEDD